VEEGYWTDADFSTARPTDTFETASGKFEFINSEIDALSRYSLIKPEGDEATYPLVLIPYDTMRLWADYIASPQFLMKSVEDTILKANDVLVELNPTTAENLGLKDGKFAVLATPVGKARVKVRLYEGIMPGLVAMPRGLGHTAFENNLVGKGANFNELIGPVEDTATGQDAAWGIRAKLTKA
jgi:anaerobic selenocysteine-containing dehydrogenase